ncbi:Beta-ketoacyl-acyl-carrier-protein synthase III [uncultured spirochete]|jgi:3-oxoacyl-[acyl-carrier-protein] synthase-3|uniref:Beta-ketoacyl-acyl-carrier-protein synthase III n=1 Tax=uncultured spirochete TaxID=156406 RepID=A0A3P3XMH9_9SPIR|nr:Beta-ketoacyl-acyl-carrier-protein synthase III [uncultured spirochete]
MHVGVAGIGLYIPKHYMTAADLAKATTVPEDVIALKFGIKRKPIAGPEETTSYMGMMAAKAALDDADIKAEDIDLLIWCGAQHKDYPCWLAGLYVANQLGATRAWSFDMEAMCGSMMAALDVAKSLMMVRDDLNTVLLVSGYRNNDLIDPSYPPTRFMMDIGSAGSACVLKKNLGRNVVLSSAFKGDGSLSEMCVVPVFGSKAWPPKPEDALHASFIVPDEQAFKQKLGEVTMPNFYAVIRESMRKSGFVEQGIDYLAILHFKRSAHLAALQELGLREDQSTYLENYGHLGQNDQLLSIKLGLETGKIREGSRIVMVGAGLGFVWACTVVQWGAWQESVKS